MAGAAVARAIAATAVGLVVILTRPAHADPRAPATTAVVLDPRPSGTVYARSTLGLLVSHDAGCSFRWICPRAIGYAGSFEPRYAVAADGTLFAATYRGLRVSRDAGCTWSTATADRRVGDRGRIADLWIDAIDLASNGDVWVATAESARPNDVYRSRDGGATFAPRNRRSATVWWKSVVVAPSNPRRVYVAGYQVAGPVDGGVPGPAAHVARSDDAGETWTPSPLGGVALAATPIVHVLAVDPTDDARVFVRALGASPPRGDRLYRSSDAGARFDEVLATTSPIRSVVIRGASVRVATDTGASFASVDRGASFVAADGAPPLACLATRGDELLGCGAPGSGAAALVRSADGTTWRDLLRFDQLAGPLRCAPGTTTHDACAPLWPALEQQLGATTPTCAADALPRAPPPRPPPETGCAEDTLGPVAAAGGGLALIVALVLRRRRRCCAP